MMNFKKRRCKSRFPNRNTITAGGILFYDEFGIYVIKEKKRDRDVYNDIGGKYQFEDGDIYATISREFGEEMYHSCELTRSQIISFIGKDGVKEINLNSSSQDNRPIYVCIVVPHKLVEDIIQISNNEFQKSRTRVLMNNPDVPISYYSSTEICHVSYDDLRVCFNDRDKLHFRLASVLQQWRNPEVKDSAKIEDIKLENLKISEETE